MADADRMTNVVDPGSPEPAASQVQKKTPRPTGAAALLGAVIPSAQADQGVRNDYVAMRSTAAAPNVDREFELLLTAGTAGAKPVPGAPRSGPSGDKVAEGGLSQLITGQAPPQPLASRILSGAKAIGVDVMSGVASAPKHVLGGLLDAVNNANDFLANATSDLPGGYFQMFNTKGEWDPRAMSHEEGRALQLEQQKARGQGEGHGFTYNMEDPDSVTGNIIRTGVSFLAARRMVGNPTSVAGNVGADIFAGAVGLNPNQPRLSNLVDSVAPNFLTDFLKAKPEDEGKLVSHLKGGLEMGGLGSIITGVVKAVKALKATLKTIPAEAGEPAASVAPAVEGGAPGKSAYDSILEMKSDIPWEEQPAFAAAAPAGSAGAAAANAGPSAVQGAKALGGVGAAPDEAAKRALALGYPDAASGNVLAPASEKVPTVEVSPELGKRFERFMAQERGEIAAPLEANEKPLAEQASKDFSATGANPVKVNLNMMNGPADLKDAIARVSAQIPAQAVRRNEAVVDAAHALAMSPEDFLAGPGRTLTDGEVVGLRMVTNDVARQFLDLAKAAGAPEAGAEARAQALAAYAKFNDMVGFMESAKAESGRSVQAWGIKVAGSNLRYADAVQRIAEVAGGPEAAGFLERMGALETPEQVAYAAKAARTMTPRDWMMYGWYNALLGPRTIVKKGMSDAFMGMWNLATRFAAEKMGPEGGVAAGETAALFQGYKGAFGDALMLARKAFIAGRSQFHAGNEYLEAFDHGQALADSAPEIAVEQPTMAMRDYLRVAASPKSYMPTTWVATIDDFATMLNYQAERHALALRHATDKGLVGTDLEAGVRSLEAETPTWLHRQAVDAAMANTFKEPLEGLAASLRDVFDNINLPVGHGGNFEIPVGRIVAPFVKIPINITRWSYTNSPIPLIFPSSRIAAELAAGGARKDLALAKMGLGSALSMSFLGMALGGTITGRGPSDPQLQRAWQAAHGGDVRHSVNIGDKYYSYNSVEPIGLMAGIVADTMDIMRFAKEEDAGQAALSLVFGAGEALMSKTYLEGVAELMKAMENPDKDSARYLDRLVSSAAVPNIVNDFRRAQDPWMRAHYDLLQTIENRLPYISQGLPPQRTLWGDAIPAKDGYAPFLTGTAAARMLSPIAIGPKGDAEPIDKWIFDNRMAFPRGPDNKLGLTRPGLTQSFSAGPNISASVELTPAQHDRLQVLAGNELKDPRTGLGAKDTLNALVEGKGPGSMQNQWNRATDAEKALIVQTVVNKFRAAAKDQVKNEYPDLKEAIEAGWAARGEALTH